MSPANLETTYIDSETIPIGKFLKDADFIKVPTFQRDFAWGDDEVTQLWNDLMEAMDLGQKQYFIGPMVLKKQKDYLEVIDGQQRIATIYCILSGIRYLLRQQKSEDELERADLLDRDYFGEKDINTLEILPKFQMNETNDPVFQKLVVNETTPDAIAGASKGLLKKNTNYLLIQTIFTVRDLLKKRQMDFSGNGFDWPTLLKIVSFIRESVYVLLLIVTDEADAAVIFETLNERGRGLSTMDLLKNHLFSKASGNIDIVKSHWTILRDNLSDIDPNDRFLYHYWTSYNGRTSRSQLFRLMRPNIKNPKTSVEFAKKLSEAAKLYSALYNPGDAFWDEYDQRTLENIDTLNLLDAQQAMPILIAAAQSFSIVEFSKLTEILVVMAIRYNLIGELRTGVLANYYADIPPKIRSGELNKAAKVFRAIKAIYPNDEDFEKAFSTKILRDAAKARYILAEIEEFASGGKVMIPTDTKKVNLEHVYPQKPSQEWKDMLASIGDDDPKKWIYRIGNLALLSAPVNKNYKGKGFDVKKNMCYKKEDTIKFTSMLSKYNTWLKSDIEDRQRKLAKFALQTWRIDIK